MYQLFQGKSGATSRTRFLTVTFFVLFAFVAPSKTLAAQAVGQVMLAVGDSNVVRGQDIYIGDEIQTGSGGHVHIRFIDDAFISVRPTSILRVEEYQYSPDQAEKNRVKFELIQGTVRSKTGRAGETNKQGFRMNTPVVAIGIRGTDFTVHADYDITRLDVTYGGVAVSKFSDTCLASGFGACEGNNLHEIFAEQNLIFEIRRSSEQPTFIKKAATVSDPANPSQDEAASQDSAENKDDEKSKQNTDCTPSCDDSDTSSLAHENLASINDEYHLQNNSPELNESQKNHQTQVNQTEQFEGKSITWGHWSTQKTIFGSQHLSLVDLAAQENRKIAAGTGYMGMFINDEINYLPSSGIVDFELQQYSAYVLDQGQSTQAQVVDPKLSMDFNNKTFNTQLKVVADNDTVDINATGSIARNGTFRQAPGQDTIVRGSLTDKNQQAGYLFEKTIAEDKSVLGGTAWTAK